MEKVNNIPQDILVSVVVPCYNQAQYLAESLNSVLEQSYTNWECIIVNDGSPDNTDEVAAEWCKKDSRFKYLDKENGGVIDARNKGIEIANGEWILPIDADNYIAKDYLKLATEVIIQNPNVGLVYSRAEYIGDKTGEWIMPDYSFRALLSYNMIDTLALYEKKSWELVGGYDPKLIYSCEDWEFWLNILSARDIDVYKLDYIGFYYRVKEESRTVTLHADAEHIRYTNEYISQKHAKVYIKYLGSFQKQIEEMNIQKSEIHYWRRKNEKRWSHKIKQFFKKIF